MKHSPINSMSIGETLSHCGGSGKCLALIALVSATVLVLLTAPAPITAYGDPTQQILAAHQYLQGKSPSPNHLVEPRPANISEDELRWITTWPPGPQIFALPWMALGLDIGSTLSIVAALGLILGALGWALWFSLFRLPGWAAVGLCLFIPWLRYASNAQFNFSAEILIYMATPWLLLGTRRLACRWENGTRTADGGWVLPAVLGFGLGFGYVLKYSGVFVAMGALTFLGLRSLGPLLISRREVSFPGLSGLLAPAIRDLLFCVIAAAVPVLAWGMVNHHFSGYVSSFDEHFGTPFRLEIPVNLIAYPGLALADADSMWSYLLLRPGHKVFQNHFVISLIGLPGGLVLFWVLFRKKAMEGAGALALVYFTVTLAALGSVWILADIGFRTRYLVTACLAVLPLALREGIRLWNTSRVGWSRVVLAVAGLAFIAIPLAYGGASVFAKLARRSYAYAAGPSGMYNPFLAPTGDAAGVLRELRQHFNPETDIWYFLNYHLVMDLPGRAIVVPANWLSTETLKKQRFRSDKRLRVLALIPKQLDKERTRLILASFPQAGEWRPRDVTDSPLALWITTLEAP